MFVNWTIHPLFPLMLLIVLRKFGKQPFGPIPSVLAVGIWAPSCWKSFISSLGFFYTYSSYLKKKQVAALSGTAFIQVHLVHQLHSFLDQGILLSFTHALVTSWKDSCNVPCMKYLENHSEATAGPEYSSMSSHGQSAPYHQPCSVSCTGYQLVSECNSRCWWPPLKPCMPQGLLIEI